jgi:ribosomal protein S18 acetylase RimI-like enzyme
MAKFEIGTASFDETMLMSRWAVEEGWNVGHTDPVAFHAADPTGYLMGRIDGEPLVSISVVRQGDAFGFLGFYIAHPSVRGKGYGIRIWNAGMARLQGRNVALDGLVAQQDNYRKSGFRPAWNNVRYQGPVPAARPPAGVTLVDARSVAFDVLSAYDRRFVVAERDAFLSLWIGLAERASVVALHDGRIAGFAVMRICPAAYKVGPVFADSPDIAQALTSALADRLGPREVAIDVPDMNPAAIRWAESMGLRPASMSARMYTGPEPAFDRAHMFGVTSLEVG